MPPRAGLGARLQICPFFSISLKDTVSVRIETIKYGKIHKNKVPNYPKVTQNMFSTWKHCLFGEHSPSSVEWLTTLVLYFRDHRSFSSLTPPTPAHPPSPRGGAAPANGAYYVQSRHFLSPSSIFRPRLRH